MTTRIHPMAEANPRSPVWKPVVKRYATIVEAERFGPELLHALTEQGPASLVGRTAQPA